MKQSYTGALHIHTSYSDGSSDIKNVAKEAKRAGLSWIIITDHNSLKGIDEEGWHDGLAVIVGNEISPKKGNHYLAFDTKTEISHEIGYENYIKEVNSQGGTGFIAHPDESDNRKNHFPPLKWENWDTKGFDGLEIWNWLSDWVDNYDSGKKFQHYFFKDRILKGPSKKTLEWWNKLNLDNPKIVPAIGGADTHALKYKFLGLNFEVFPYYNSFKTLSNVIYLDNELSKDFDTAKNQILTALKQGNNTIVNRTWNKNKKNPLFYIENKNVVGLPGETITYDNYTKAVVKLPHRAKIRLIYDGQLVWECEKEELLFEYLDKGKYRVEIYYKDYPWAFSNPINLI
ncbi:MAG: PHP domain-containing protein [Candidatus Gastranaerophilales bacterium]|nr:PHP domain-containing protein [Candidatus Gastranaerophilales bacterium]